VERGKGNDDPDQGPAGKRKTEKQSQRSSRHEEKSDELRETMRLRVVIQHVRFHPSARLEQGRVHKTKAGLFEKRAKSHCQRNERGKDRQIENERENVQPDNEQLI